MEQDKPVKSVEQAMFEEELAKRMERAAKAIDEIMLKEGVALLAYIDREYTRDQAKVRLVNAKEFKPKEVINPNVSNTPNETKKVKGKKKA